MPVVGALLAIAMALSGDGRAEASPPDSAEVAPATQHLVAHDVQIVRNWVARSGDNHGRPYMVIDKRSAEVLVFDAWSRLIGRTPALLGSATGDDSSPGIGDRELRNIPRSERTTPAGRFVAKFGLAAGRKKVLWVDWSTALSLHPVVTANRRERRLDRLASPTPEDNRITFGCINVAKDFYHELVAPMLEGSEAVVYILPEERTLQEVFWQRPGAALSGAGS